MVYNYTNTIKLGIIIKLLLASNIKYVNLLKKAVVLVLTYP